MRRRGPELTALLLAAHIVSLCLLFAEADALVRTSKIIYKRNVCEGCNADGFALP